MAERPDASTTPADATGPSDSSDGGTSSRPDSGRWADRGVVPAPNTKTVWVVVADEAIARILEWPKGGEALVSVQALTDAAAHAKEGDMHRDAYGRRSGSATHSASPNPAHRLRSSANVTSSAGEDQQHLEGESFARRVSQHLAEALQQQRFDELRIIAAPRFLGQLRKELDAHVAATVTEEINKDLVHMDNAEITRRLTEGAGAGGIGA